MSHACWGGLITPSRHHSFELDHMGTKSDLYTEYLCLKWQSDNVDKVAWPAKVLHRATPHSSSTTNLRWTMSFENRLALDSSTIKYLSIENAVTWCVPWWNRTDIEGPWRIFSLYLHTILRNSSWTGLQLRWGQSHFTCLQNENYFSPVFVHPEVIQFT